ncbi:MAG TPA: RsmE family RNA methyltransferase, partial [Mycobacterium sp.]|nr:RsmE family RNA methyltransferase [Mycobacterium sp.]
GDRADKGLRRWRAVARSAARQSRRAYIPEVSGPITTAALTRLVAERVGAGAVVLALHESASRALADIPLAQSDSIILVVGPEGGIDDDELADLAAAGARPARLGPTVLRTSTAAAVALGALGVLTDRWATPPP